MSREWVGPDRAFTIRYPDDWSFVRRLLRPGELDSGVLHQIDGALGSVRVTAWRLKDEAEAVKKFIARMQELYSNPIEGETEVLDLMQGPIAGKNGFIRSSRGEEDGTQTFHQMFVVGAGRTVVMANYVVPLRSAGTPEHGGGSDCR